MRRVKPADGKAWNRTRILTGAGTAALLEDFPRLWRGTSQHTRKGILSTIFEEIRVSGDTIRQIKPRPRYLELVTLGMLNGLQAQGLEAVRDHQSVGGRCGRAERI